MWLGDVVYLGERLRMRVRVDANGGGGCRCVVLEDGMLHGCDGSGRGGRWLLNVNGLQGRRGWGQGCGSWKGLDLLGQQLLLNVLLCSLLEFAVFLHLLGCEGDRLALQGGQGRVLSPVSRLNTRLAAGRCVTGEVFKVWGYRQQAGVHRPWLTTTIQGF